MADAQSTRTPTDGGMTIRQATLADHDAVAAFTSNTWADRDVDDYIPHIYPEWIADDGEGQRTFVLDAGDDTVTQETPDGTAVEHSVAGICQGVLLSDHEAWAQGMRVNSAYRGLGASLDLTNAVFDWAGEQGATVCRNMVFSWNVAGLGQSRAAGFEPCTEFRWAHPSPDADAEPGLPVRTDPAAAWQYWSTSDARTHLQGLGLDLDESWALSELHRERLARVADETALFTVVDGRSRALAYRSRTYERDEGDEAVRWAEYGVGAWADTDAARALFAAIARDAASVDADRTRVLIPETPRHVTDASYVRAGIAEEPDFVLAADLTDRD